MGDSSSDCRPTAAPSSPASRFDSWSFSTACLLTTSSSVSVAFPASAAGRSSGMVASYRQTPWRSGSPHGVRAGVDVDVASVDVLAAGFGAAVDGEHPTRRTGVARRPAHITKRRLIALLTSPVRSFGSGIADAKLPVQQLLHELDALVFEDRRVLFEAAIQRHADLPGSGKDFRVFDRRLVHQVRAVDGRVTFDHVKRLAVEISGAVEPRLIVEAGDVDDQRVTLPVPARPSHPRIRGARADIIDVNRPGCPGKLVR